MAKTKPRRRNNWGAVRELNSGSYQASYLGPDGNRHLAPHTFPYRQQATDFLAQTRTAIISNQWRAPNDIEDEDGVTFVDYALRHIELQTTKKGTHLRPATKALYEKLLRLHLTDFHSMQVAAITKPQVDEWWSRSLKSGKHTSISKAYKLLSVVMKRAVEDGLRDASPCRVTGAHSTSTGVIKYVPTPSDVNAISKAINPRYSALVVIAAYSALRYQEFAELRRKDVELVTSNGRSQYVFHIRRAVSWVDGKAIVGPPKSDAGWRDVEIHHSLTPLISDYLKTRTDGLEDLVFPSANGTHLRHDVLMGSWNRAKVKAGTKADNFTPHSLRHFGATYYAKAGATLPELQRWLGDSSKAVMVYLHPTNQGAHFANLMELPEENI